MLPSLGGAAAQWPSVLPRTWQRAPLRPPSCLRQTRPHPFEKKIRTPQTGTQAHLHAAQAHVQRCRAWHPMAVNTRSQPGGPQWPTQTSPIAPWSVGPVGLEKGTAEVHHRRAQCVGHTLTAAKVNLLPCPCHLAHPDLGCSQLTAGRYCRCRGTLLYRYQPPTRLTQLPHKRHRARCTYQHTCQHTQASTIPTRICIYSVCCWNTRT